MGQLFFVGDSITAGAWDERGGWAARLIGEIMQHNIEAQTAGDGFYCLPYNLGVSGDTAVLARLENEISVRSDGIGPDRTEIVLYIGSNDAMYLNNEQRPRFTDQEFTDNITVLLKQARSLAARVSCLGLLPADEARTVPLPYAKEFSCEQQYLKITSGSSRRPALR